jgi:hypothetical protein
LRKKRTELVDLLFPIGGWRHVQNRKPSCRSIQASLADNIPYTSKLRLGISKYIIFYIMYINITYTSMYRKTIVLKKLKYFII